MESEGRERQRTRRWARVLKGNEGSRKLKPDLGVGKWGSEEEMAVLGNR